MNSIPLKSNKSRIEFDCEIKGKPFRIWVDTGSPNTLVHEKEEFHADIISKTVSP